MNKAWPIVLLGLLLVAASQESATPRIAVVHLNQVFEGYHKKGNLEKELNEVRNALQQTISKMEKSLSQIRSQMELLDKETSRYRELEKNARHLREDLKYEQRNAAEKLQRKKAEFHEKLLQEIRTVILSYGREHGYSLILQKEFTLSADARSWHSVLYHAPDVDLTGQILAVLNE